MAHSINFVSINKCYLMVDVRTIILVITSSLFISSHYISPVICIIFYVPVILIILHMLTIIVTILGNAVISLASTAQHDIFHPGEFVTFLCIANGSRLVWTLNSMSEISFDNLESIETYYS